MMQHQEKYILKRHSYSDHLRKMMKEMMISGQFADVTLVTDDNEQIMAHRNILSTCSPVFKDILQLDSTITSPVIYLIGIQHSEMESIMEFIYLGEARIYKERMSEFLIVSKNLEIKELSIGTEMNDQTASSEEYENDKEEYVDEDSEQASYEESGICQSQAQISPKHKTTHNGANRRVFTSKGEKYVCGQCDHQFTCKDNLTKHIKSIHEGVRYACNQCDHQATRPDSLATHIQSIHEGIKYGCNQCGQQYTQQCHLRNHIQSKHEGVKYACNQCEYQATFPSTLKSHIQSKHEGIKYACDQCDQQFTTKSVLKTHILSKHEGFKYACNQCDHQATRQGDLKKHIHRKH